MNNTLEYNYDIVVVGAGHAGCEAALCAARLGYNTIIFTVSIDSIAMMPCNPNIGGTSKGHLVREIDALGGQMGINIDKTFIQSKMLNKSKGPAVHSLRAQADKKNYSAKMRETLENTEGLDIRQAEVASIIVEDGVIKGIKTTSGTVYNAKAVILCTGVYLKAKCISGDDISYTGPNGLAAANSLSQSLIDNGIEIRRFKTGTPARVDKRTIDFSKMDEQKGDEQITPFSFNNKAEDIEREQISCWLTYTNEETHDIIRNNIERSPLFSGVIEGTGPRYCPSIEDKVMRFSDKNRHQVFIEPEGEYTNEMYIGGMSTSLPEDVQFRMYRSVPGLENAHIVRNGYAIEYDCINPLQLKQSLEFKKVSGLFAAGQINGSSGYEEAAAQGIVAGINSVMYIKGEKPVIIDRSQGYIGVLIDDLVTKGTNEPYRMMTSRAEYRLLLRQDNADQRMTPLGYKLGLISEERYQKYLTKISMIEDEVNRIKEVYVSPSDEVNDIMKSYNTTPITTGISLEELIRRPELDYNKTASFDKKRKPLDSDITEQVENMIKYEGYIARQIKQVEQYKKMEGKLIPEDIDYNNVGNLRLEAIQKLNQVRPSSIGQASRISGVSPADISVLLVYVKSLQKE
ncbi:MAG: tRNA uridine-5-carboxymethylaminomethyl(34) synthesis enzyme MnmG [Lachnospiraceae bacterium]|jgi:tRNA uridine 5-carboxymethylaminomethyl modification enzyme